MGTVAYDISIGSLSASSRSNQNPVQLLSLTSELTMDGAGGRCSLEFAASDATLPKPGDTTQITLDDGSASAVVFTGEMFGIATSPTRYIVTGTDGLTKLARLDIEAAYESVSAGSIASELVQTAGLSAGNIEDGPTFSRYVLHRGPRALRHLQRLAESCGFDLFTDGEGKVHFEAPRSGSADHSFQHAEQVLELDLQVVLPVYDGLVVWGEGAASSMGSDKDHWLASDLASTSGKASIDANFTVQSGSEGNSPRIIKDGAVRAGADAADQATARMTAIASRAIRGHAVVLGSPGVNPGDLVSFEDIPDRHPTKAVVEGKVIRVRRVRHSLSPERGFTTRLEF